MRLAAAALVIAFGAQAQAPAPTPDTAEKAEKKKAAKPAVTDEKRRPRVSLKPKGGTGSNVGDDASGGGGTSAQPSKGGTPGTPSGSFTGPPSRP